MNKATIAGTFPIPKSGIINASRAKEGTVCNILAKPTITLAVLGKRVKVTPIGTATKTPSPKAIAEI